MKRILLIALALGAAGIAVSTTHHGTDSNDPNGPPWCLPGDPSPPCPAAPAPVR